MKGNCVLIFGESYNDAVAIGHLVKALKPDAPNVKPRRSPIILSRNAAEAKRKKNRNLIADVVSAQMVTARVTAVILHRDCDAVEPAHRDASANLAEGFRIGGIAIIPVTPAFEIEAWWFLWPDAVATLNHKWKKLQCWARNHGMIANVKEELIRALRPSKGTITNDYAEADSPRIAEMVRKMGIVHQRCGQSNSFDDFVHGVDVL